MSIIGEDGETVGESSRRGVIADSPRIIVETETRSGRQLRTARLQMASMDGTRIIPRRYCCRSLLYLPPLLTVPHNSRFVSYHFCSRGTLSFSLEILARVGELSFSCPKRSFRRNVGRRVEKFGLGRKLVIEERWRAICRLLEIDCRRVPSTRQSIECHLSNVIVKSSAVSSSSSCCCCVKAALEATSVIDYAGKLIRQRLAVIRMQRTDPISLSPAGA